MLMEDNIKALGEVGFQEIVATDPHSLNALRNEYLDVGTVHHYTGLLALLIREGKLWFSEGWTIGSPTTTPATWLATMARSTRRARSCVPCAWAPMSSYSGNPT